MTCEAYSLKISQACAFEFCVEPLAQKLARLLDKKQMRYIFNFHSVLQILNVIDIILRLILQ